MIIEKGLAISFWVGVAILALIGSVYLNVWAEQITSFTNDKGHECYIAMTLDYEIYHICYPSLDERLLGETSYSSIPDLTFGEVVIDSGNTQTSPNLNDTMGLFN
tara:strand:+ start:471 stop:785 length:315 start_codon:yes stop_codon:yes gene_type:complete